MSMMVDMWPYEIIACVRSDVIYNKPIVFSLASAPNDTVVFGGRSRFGKHECLEMPDERFFYAARATMLRMSSFYLNLDHLHTRMRRDRGFARWEEFKLPQHGVVLNNPEGFLGRYLQWMDMRCAIAHVSFRQVHTAESRWFHNSAVKFNSTCPKSNVKFKGLSS